MSYDCLVFIFGIGFYLKPGGFQNIYSKCLKSEVNYGKQQKKSNKNILREENILREDVLDLVRDLILYGMIVEYTWGNLLVKNSERFDHVDIALSSENGYTVLTVKRFYEPGIYDVPNCVDGQGIEFESYFEDTGFAHFDKIVMVLPEDKCRFVKKYGYENFKFSKREKLGIEDWVVVLGSLWSRCVFYTKPLLEIRYDLPEWRYRKFHLEKFEESPFKFQEVRE